MTSTQAAENTGRSVKATLHAALDTSSSGERKVARALLASYPAAGLGTVAELAKRAGVSPPTVVRFIARLGYQGFPNFQRALVKEVDESMGSPLEQYSQHERPVGEGLLSHAHSTFSEMLNNTFADLPESEFRSAVDLICDPRRTIRVIGGRFSRLLADYLVAHMQLLRPAVSVVGQDEISRLSAIADIKPSTLFVVYDFRRYDDASIEFASAAAERGASLVLVTDNWLSPIAKFATAVLPCRVESPSPFDSLVPAMAVTESIVAAVTEELGAPGRKRLEVIESVFHSK